MQEMPRKIEVGDLSGKTLNYLSHSLDKPTLNSWEDLMRSQTFRSIYLHITDAPEKIRLKSQGLVHPAESLLQDLAKRKTPLEDLICGLREIGNKEAISIIEHREKWLEEKMSNSFSPQDSGGRPPPSLSIPRQPEENCSSASLSYARCASSVKTQGETYPIQESAGFKEDRPCNPDRLQQYMGMIFNYFFPCFELLGRPK
ncbi:unnamed protein product [Porites lobata]|uniref:CARD domain-containing protein n=1 Tax=Porites lobata TaxID=104759 RepID=A0ABN8N911_9CNID|nr:unnamed protein product [Porites lobata]